LNPKP
ncbi:hypothetical protein KSW81_002328, partial [Nannochloris sp. 'desiccata']